MIVQYNEEALSEKMTELYEKAIAEYIEENNTEEAFEEELNEVYGEVEICGYSFEAGRAYKELDPIGFRCGLSDNEYIVRERAEEEINEDDFRDQALEDLNMEHVN
jgi:hypothetical protein